MYVKIKLTDKKRFRTGTTIKKTGVVMMEEKRTFIFEKCVSELLEDTREEQIPINMKE